MSCGRSLVSYLPYIIPMAHPPNMRLKLTDRPRRSLGAFRWAATSMMSRRALVLLIALFAIGRSAFTQRAPDSSVCYRLAYRSGGREDPSQLFAEYIEVQTAHDRIARSGMGPG